MLARLVGAALGAALSPLTGLVSALRQSRMFHPRGVVLRARVVPAGSERWADVAARLTGPALVRLSSAWWKRFELPDVLGCAIRFAEDPEAAAGRPGADAQDLLFATVRRPWTTPFAPLSTDVRDFFANDYYTVSPFRLPDDTVMEWRLTPLSQAKRGADRAERLAVTLASGEAGFVLEARPYPGVLRRRGPSWEPVALVLLEERLDVDQERLRFDPFLTGRGIEPHGPVQAMRRATYATSQAARPKRDRDRDRAAEVAPARPRA